MTQLGGRDILGICNKELIFTIAKLQKRKNNVSAKIGTHNTDLDAKSTYESRS